MTTISHNTLPASAIHRIDGTEFLVVLREGDSCERAILDELLPMPVDGRLVDGVLSYGELRCSPVLYDWFVWSNATDAQRRLINGQRSRGGKPTFK